MELLKTKNKIIKELIATIIGREVEEGEGIQYFLHWNLQLLGKFISVYPSFFGTANGEFWNIFEL